jgi:hypothetical protein
MIFVTLLGNRFGVRSEVGTGSCFILPGRARGWSGLWSMARIIILALRREDDAFSKATKQSSPDLTVALDPSLVLNDRQSLISLPRLASIEVFT